MNHIPEGYSAARTRFWTDLKAFDLRELQHSFVNLWAEGYRQYLGLKNPQRLARWSAILSLVGIGLVPLLWFEVHRATSKEAD